MKKCMYAGDTTDEYCKDCDGVKLLNKDGTTDPIDKCPGYTPGEEEIGEESEEPKEETPVPEDDPGKDAEPVVVKEEPKKATTSKPQKKSPEPNVS